MTDRNRDLNARGDAVRMKTGETAGGTVSTDGQEACLDARATLSLHHWHALDTVLAEMCERTHGTLEDLHDRGRGILEHCRPGTWRTAPRTESEATALLWEHVHRVVGALAHLEDAAPDDARAIHDISKDVYALADRLAVHPAEPPS